MLAYNNITTATASTTKRIVKSLSYVQLTATSLTFIHIYQLHKTYKVMSQNDRTFVQ